MARSKKRDGVVISTRAGRAERSSTIRGVATARLAGSNKQTALIGIMYPPYLIGTNATAPLRDGASLRFVANDVGATTRVPLSGNRPTAHLTWS